MRYVRDPSTEEFVNVGVLLAAPGLKFYGARFIPSWVRVSGMFPDADLGHLRRLAAAMEGKLQTWTEQQRVELPLFDPPTLRATLHQIFNEDEPSFRPGSLLKGQTSSPEAALAELFEHHIGRFLPQAEVVTRSDQDIWRGFVSSSGASIAQAFEPLRARGPHLDYDFPYAWNNGEWNALQPLSFDLVDPSRIRDKATVWMGRVLALRMSQQNIHLSFILGMPRESRPQDVKDAARDARLLLQHGLPDVQLWDEGQVHALVERIERDTNRQGKPGASKRRAAV